MAGRGNYPSRESKKPKKNAKKPKSIGSILTPPPQVESIKKERKHKHEEDVRQEEE